MRVRSPKNFWAGLMFAASGAFFAVWAATHYQMGTAVRMGPAYFPAVLGGLLFLLGVLIALQSLVVEGPRVDAFALRPLALISLACLAYGYLMKPLGLVGATAALVYVSAFGGHEFNWKEVTILFLVLIAFSILVFVKALTLPFPLWPEYYE